MINILFGAADVCDGIKPFLTLLSYVVLIVKIVIPLLLIIFGMLDVGKAVVAGKDDEVSKALKHFIMRAIAAILVFFIPSIVGVLMSAVDQATGDSNNGWSTCAQYAGLK